MNYKSISVLLLLAAAGCGSSTAPCSPGGTYNITTLTAAATNGVMCPTQAAFLVNLSSVVLDANGAAVNMGMPTTCPATCPASGCQITPANSASSCMGRATLSEMCGDGVGSTVAYTVSGNQINLSLTVSTTAAGACSYTAVGTRAGI